MMERFIGAGMIVSLGFGFAAVHTREQVEWLQDKQKAEEQARQQDRLILVELSTDWCAWCRKLEEETLADEDVRQRLAKFVLLRLNPEKSEFGRELMDRAGARGFPATIVADQDWTVLSLVAGYKPPEEFQAALDQVLQPYAKYQELQQTARAGNATLPQLKAVSKAALQLHRLEDVRTFAQQGLSKAEGEERVHFAYFLARSTDPQDPKYAERKLRVKDLDAQNRHGYLDDLVVHEVVRLLNSAEGKEDAETKIAEATQTLLERTESSVPLHAEKGQVIYWILYQLSRGTAPRDAEEYLRRGVALKPESDLGRGMQELLKSAAR